MTEVREDDMRGVGKETTNQTPETKTRHLTENEKQHHQNTGMKWNETQTWFYLHVCVLTTVFFCQLSTCFAVQRWQNLPSKIWSEEKRNHEIYHNNQLLSHDGLYLSTVNTMLQKFNSTVVPCLLEHTSDSIVRC